MLTLRNRQADAVEAAVWVEVAEAAEEAVEDAAAAAAVKAMVLMIERTHEC